MCAQERERSKRGTIYDQEQLDLLEQCVGQRDMTAWNERRQQEPDRPVLLQKVDLEKAYLRGADFRQADFRGANLRGVDLSGAKRSDYTRRWADLSDADFTEADLCLTDCRGANLRRANFTRAYLYYTNLSWTDLSGANLNGADLWAFLYKAVLTSVDLHQANRRLKELTRVGCQLTPKKDFSLAAAMERLKAASMESDGCREQPQVSSPCLVPVFAFDRHAVEHS